MRSPNAISGPCIANGQGVKQNFDEAVKWYYLAAEQGDADAQINLGNMYFEGKGVQQSYEKAYACWIVASANGAEMAQYNMEIAQRQMTLNQIKSGQQFAKQIWANHSN